MTNEWPSYIVPTFAALLLHAVAMVFFLGGWDFSKRSPTLVEPKVIKASLVTLQKPQPKKSVAVAKKLNKQKPVKKAADKPVAKTKTEKTTPEKVKQDVKAPPVAQKIDALNQLLEEENQRLSEQQMLEQAQRDAELIDQYSALMRDAITSNWSRPPSARQDMVVVLAIQLVPTGDVVSVEVVESSGNAAVCLLYTSDAADES